jgi:hypothetical protein
MSVTLEAPVKQITLASQLPDILLSCSLTPPPPPPEPPPVEDEVIYTPVAPGIIYEALPEVVIIDTSPDQLIGCIFDTADKPQSRLNALFPSAESGDGVVERRNNDIWVYDGSAWNNVGPNPGPTIQSTTAIILPYNETAIYEGRVRLLNLVSKFDYSLQLLTEVDPLVVKVGIDLVRVTAIVVPQAVVSVAAEPPGISISARVDIPLTDIELEPIAPLVSSGKSVAVPITQIELEALVPETVGRPRTSILAPFADISLAVAAPELFTGASVTVPVATIELAAIKPTSVGKLDTEAFDLFLLIEDDLLNLRSP